MDPVVKMVVEIASILLVGALGEFIFARTRVPDVVWLVAAGILAGPVSGLIPAGLLKPGIPFFGAIALTIILSNGAFRLQLTEVAAADVPADQAALMARSQVLNFADNFSATITTAAWRTKPSWMLVAGSDRTISPDLERWYAKRAHSHMVEVAGASHCVYVSHPKQVAEAIESAASAVSK